MSLRFVKNSATIFEITSGWTVSDNIDRQITKSIIPMTNQIYIYDMVTNEKTYNFSFEVSPANSSYTTQAEIKTALDNLFPSEASEFSVEDDDNIWNISKCIIENRSISDTPDVPNGFRVTLKVVEYTTNFTA